jgi:hypothetical protein
MFGLIAPRCPVDTYEKAWTEWTLRSLASEFSIDALLKARVILPTPEFFPELAGNLSELDAERILDRLCGYLAIERNKVRLEVRPDANTVATIAPLPTATPVTTIRVLKAQLAQPLLLIPALLHELANQKLAARVEKDRTFDWSVELLPIFFGLGIFGANASMQKEFRSDASWNGWRSGQSGVLPVRVFGYALASFAFIRRDENPSWAEYLIPDARVTMQAGLRYLAKTGDTIFHRETIRNRRSNLWSSHLLAGLQSEFPSQRVTALWEIRKHPVTEASVVAAVADCLGDRNPTVARFAAVALGDLGSVAAKALPALIQALGASSLEARGGVIYALGALKQNPQMVVPRLAEQLHNDDYSIVAQAATSLRQYGRQAESAAPQLVIALKRASIDCYSWLVDHLASTMLAVMPNPEKFVREHFADGDADFERQVLDAIEEQREREAQASDPD